MENRNEEKMIEISMMQHDLDYDDELREEWISEIGYNSTDAGRIDFLDDIGYDSDDEPIPDYDFSGEERRHPDIPNYDFF